VRDGEADEFQKGDFHSGMLRRAATRWRVGRWTL
jgi:hypothetical protein